MEMSCPAPVFIEALVLPDYGSRASRVNSLRVSGLFSGEIAVLENTKRVEQSRNLVHREIRESIIELRPGPYCNGTCGPLDFVVA